MMALTEIQPALYQRFKKIMQNQMLFHAYLFNGEFGSFDFAIWLAQSQFCENLNSGCACGHCHNCKLILANDFSDVQIVQPIGQTIKVEQIRSMISELNQTGFEGKKRFFIVRSVELLSQSAANALLKFIEEPQADIYLIFITNQVDRVLPTIQSRTQIIHFKKNTDYLCEKLKQQDILPTQASFLAHIAPDFETAIALNEVNWFNNGSQIVKQWIVELINCEKTAFTSVSAKLVPTFDDKEKQKMAFKMIAYFLEKEMLKDYKHHFLTHLLKSEQMFQFNVSFQNCLEYLVMKSLWR